MGVSLFVVFLLIMNSMSPDFFFTAKIPFQTFQFDKHPRSLSRDMAARQIVAFHPTAPDTHFQVAEAQPAISVYGMESHELRTDTRKNEFLVAIAPFAKSVRSWPPRDPYSILSGGS